MITFLFRPFPLVLVRLAVSFYLLASMCFVLHIVSHGVRDAEASMSLPATHMRCITLSVQRRAAFATCTVEVTCVYHYGLCSLVAHISGLSYRDHLCFRFILYCAPCCYMSLITCCNCHSFRVNTFCVCNSYAHRFGRFACSIEAPFAPIPITYLLVRNIHAVLEFFLSVAYTAFNILITLAIYAVPLLSSTSLRFLQDDLCSHADVNLSVGALFATVSSPIVED